MDINSYITGFVDGEGCFQISFSLRKKMKFGVEIRPSFSLSQHKRNKDIILFLQKFFNCGGIRFSQKDQNYKYEVRSTQDLVKYVIPHFRSYPLQTDKKEQFQRFVEICEIIHSNHHLSREGLEKIIKLSDKINITGNKRINRKDLLRMVAR